MYVVGGFDGTRLNDMYHISVSGSFDSEEIAQSLHKYRPVSSSSLSGMMNTVPSDLSVISVSDSNMRWDDNSYLRKKVIIL